MISSAAWAQETSEPPPSVKLKRGQPAPDEGRWLREDYFLVWYRSSISMREQIPVLKDELARSRSERARLEAELYAARTEIKNVQLQLSLQDFEMKKVKQERDARWTSGQVTRIALGSAAVSVLLVILVASSFE